MIPLGSPEGRDARTTTWDVSICFSWTSVYAGGGAIVTWMTAGKPSRCLDVPGLVSKTIQDAFILQLHDWPVRVIPIYVQHHTHGHDTYTVHK